MYGFEIYIKRCYLDSYWDNYNIVKIYVPHITFDYINFGICFKQHFDTRYLVFYNP